MKILFAEWDCYGKDDLKETFAAEGHSVVCCPMQLHGNSQSEQPMLALLHKEGPDIVFSFNYFTHISDICNKENIKYVSWTYDSPNLSLYSDTVINPCNIIYVFDKDVYMQFHKAGIDTVHYMPLAVNVSRLDRMGKSLPFQYDVSFVGSLYVERGNYYDQMAADLPDYAKGYLDGLMAAQLKIQGYNFIEESLGPVIDDLYKAFPIVPAGMESREFLYAHAVINRRITAIERLDLLLDIANAHRVDLFTHYGGVTMPGLRNHGSVDSYSEMPLVFKQSKINLNITLRSIQNAIPLRAFDIMGAGGFLLSNFQAEFLDFFVPGEDFIYYEDKEDLLKKIDYYLIHEDERAAIAKNGHDKVAAAHTYRHRVKEMLDF